MFLFGITIYTPVIAQTVWYNDCASASVGWGQEGARSNAGKFTIPAGSVATQLTYRNDDPGGIYTRNTVGSAIYSVTQKNYLSNPATLPPGDYWVYASGKPGATAKLCYSLVKTGRTYTGRSYTSKPPVTQPPVNGSRSTLTRGWDIFNDPLSSGNVVWNISGQNLQVSFQLSGAKPDHSYTVGAHLFNRASLASVPQPKQFGGYAVGGEGTISRESKGAYVVAWDFGQLNTDRGGNGSARFNLPVPPGTYYVQFTVRIGGSGTCLTSRGITHGCSVVYRTGNRFAEQFETITIPGGGRSYTSRPPVSQQCPPGPHNIRIDRRWKGDVIVSVPDGVFTVPQGCQAIINSFFWQDGTPGTGRSTQIGKSNIYSHTQQLYINAPNAPLPEGIYTFRIDGHPNATGHLQYKLVPTAGTPIGQPQTGQSTGQQPPVPQPPTTVDDALNIFKKARDIFGK
jgi:hypothetical protein